MGLVVRYGHELRDVETQIRHYAAICGVELEDAKELDDVIHDHKASGLRAALRAMLILRLKVEAGMMDAGLTPRPELPEDDR